MALRGPGSGPVRRVVTELPAAAEVLHERPGGGAGQRLEGAGGDDADAELLERVAEDRRPVAGGLHPPADRAPRGRREGAAGADRAERVLTGRPGARRAVAGAADARRRS